MTKTRYRVIHQRKSVLEAIFSGRTWTDWYIAQHRRWYGWEKLGTFQTVQEAEDACEAHAGGRLLRGGSRIVSEFGERE